MKTACAIVFGLLLGTAPAFAQRAPVAEVYPGAVPLRKPDPNQVELKNMPWDLKTVAAYLSKDPAAKVAAFYRNKIAKSVSEPDKDEYYFITHEWTAGELGKETAGVRVLGNGKAGESSIGGFSKLSPIPGKHTQQEVAQMQAKYAHLKRAWFNLTDEKDPESGRFMDYQQKLYREYAARDKGPAVMSKQSGEELSRRMMELINQGKMKEAQELGRQMAGASQQAADYDPWPVWIEYFEKLNANAYATVVLIDFTPVKR